MLKPRASIIHYVDAGIISEVELEACFFRSTSIKWAAMLMASRVIDCKTEVIAEGKAAKSKVRGVE